MEKEITFILPCLNEEKTLEFCLNEIENYIKQKNLNAEILLADNNSTDKSREIAKKHNVRVVICKEKGYGKTLINGTKHAYGKYCIMGDCDGSYDFADVDGFIELLRNGYDLVVGNRFAGGIEKGAMPLSHHWGVKMLSGIANFFFKTPIKDYHCGLRGYNKQRMIKLNLKQGGMEYASEMIIKAQKQHYKMIEIPTKLRKDLRDRKPHLKTITDGIKHLKLIVKLIYTE